ncbi:hypothetical protein ACRALDRAFT_2022252 [Sodiomyces alcalophilus JCM 7366]|uniref:uncharacterized protein n=1 Tax=Sodiomyces alcalophilus JCM 7366 TaxID=591952 RepID=UPI0039B49A62
MRSTFKTYEWLGWLVGSSPRKAAKTQDQEDPANALADSFLCRIARTPPRVTRSQTSFAMDISLQCDDFVLDIPVVPSLPVENLDGQLCTQVYVKIPAGKGPTYVWRNDHFPILYRFDRYSTFDPIVTYIYLLLMAASNCITLTSEETKLPNKERLDTYGLHSQASVAAEPHDSRSPSFRIPFILVPVVVSPEANSQPDLRQCKSCAGCHPPTPMEGKLKRKSTCKNNPWATKSSITRCVEEECDCRYARLVPGSQLKLTDFYT